ncbi:MAG: sortase [Candidatus Blackburnbacteria bacterium]|nr:sortase [Candidatus Blackburnbacteria bacterium]
MIAQGVIYDAKWGLNSGEIIIIYERGSRLALVYNRLTQTWEHLQDSEAALGLIRGIGLGLIITSISGLGFASYPLISSETNYRVNSLLQTYAKQKETAELLAIQNQDKADRQYAQTFAEQVGITNLDFSVYIPKIDARSPVIKNVDAGNEKDYTTALKNGIAHAQGSSLPGTNGGTYLFAHSTNGPWNVSQYNAVFYLLRELDPKNQDEIYVFYDGKLYKYRVAEKHIVDADDVSWLNKAQNGAERLILQTCWPPGTTWKRLVVIAYPDKEESPSDLNNLNRSETGQEEIIYGGV